MMMILAALDSRSRVSGLSMDGFGVIPFSLLAAFPTTSLGSLPLTEATFFLECVLVTTVFHLITDVCRFCETNSLHSAHF